MHLAFGPHGATLRTEDGAVVSLCRSPAALAAAYFHHDPPAAREPEQAIDIVEDALMSARLPRVGGTGITTVEPLLRRLPGLEALGSTLRREPIEALFQQLASMALGLPMPGAAVLAHKEVAAALLIARECMHHIGFDWIRVEHASS